MATWRWLPLPPPSNRCVFDVRWIALGEEHAELREGSATPELFELAKGYFRVFGCINQANQPPGVTVGAGMDEDVVGVQLAPDGVAVFGRRAMEVLIAAAAAQRLHVGHPEVVAERADHPTIVFTNGSTYDSHTGLTSPPPAAYAMADPHTKTDAQPAQPWQSDKPLVVRAGPPAGGLGGG
jgi:hypothetical protein